MDILIQKVKWQSQLFTKHDFTKILLPLLNDNKYGLINTKNERFLVLYMIRLNIWVK